MYNCGYTNGNQCDKKTWLLHFYPCLISVRVVRVPLKTFRFGLCYLEHFSVFGRVVRICNMFLVVLRVFAVHFCIWLCCKHLQCVSVFSVAICSTDVFLIFWRFFYLHVFSLGHRTIPPLPKINIYLAILKFSRFYYYAVFWKQKHVLYMAPYS